jgi:hypothetical protein
MPMEKPYNRCSGCGGMDLREMLFHIPVSRILYFLLSYQKLLTACGAFLVLSQNQ